MKIKTSTIRLILGDQLNQEHSWYREKRDDVLYVLAELRSETNYVAHHIQKVVALFLAMRSIASRLKSEGHRVEYIRLDQVQNNDGLEQIISSLVARYDAEQFEYQLPDEYRVDILLQEITKRLPVPTTRVDSEHFLTSRQDFARHFTGKKEYLMESFYRAMRRRYKILMEGDKPVGDKWNFDHENRKKLPKTVKPPPALIFNQNVEELVTFIQQQGVNTIGSINPQAFEWPTTRSQALRALEYFCTELLPQFGDYQDAMHTEHRNLFHSRLSFCLNVKLISPLEVLNRVVIEWQNRPQEIEIHHLEGFVRQILGWREYMRGIYWTHMPEYAQRNFFGHTRALPRYYWDGKTKMNCLHHSITQSLEDAYAHHIQRLMLTGNFALLAGIDPDHVDAWYLGIYIDAIQWVEITNTRGMSQYADGGLVGSKPYASTANYIHKMSNYCATCFYSRDKRYGERACPFNSLYWNFYEKHRDVLAQNPRNWMVYRQLDKMDTEEKSKIRKQASEYLKVIDTL